MPVPSRVLLIKPSSLGDVVHALPALRALKRAMPETRFDWLVNTEWAPVLQGNADLDRVLEFPRGEFRGLFGPMRAARWARAQDWRGPDLALDFQGLLRSALLAKASGAKRIFGLADAREGSARFYHRCTGVADAGHAVQRYLNLAALAGADTSGPVDFALPRGMAPAGFDPSTPFVVLHPFARGEAKSLPAETVGNVVRALAPVRVVVVGRGKTQTGDFGAEDWIGKTALPELIWLCREAAAVCSVDSGPMHIAAAVNAKVLGLYSWADPRRVGPYRAEAQVWKAGAFRRMEEVWEWQRPWGANEAFPPADALADKIAEMLD